MADPEGIQVNASISSASSSPPSPPPSSFSNGLENMANTTPTDGVDPQQDHRPEAELSVHENERLQQNESVENGEELILEGVDSCGDLKISSTTSSSVKFEIIDDAQSEVKTTESDYDPTCQSDAPLTKRNMLETEQGGEEMLLQVHLATMDLTLDVASSLDESKAESDSKQENQAEPSDSIGVDEDSHKETDHRSGEYIETKLVASTDSSANDAVEGVIASYGHARATLDIEKCTDSIDNPLSLSDETKQDLQSCSSTSTMETEQSMEGAESAAQEELLESVNKAPNGVEEELECHVTVGEAAVEAQAFPDRTSNATQEETASIVSESNARTPLWNEKNQNDACVEESSVEAKGSEDDQGHDIEGKRNRETQGPPDCTTVDGMSIVEAQKSEHEEGQTDDSQQEAQLKDQVAGALDVTEKEIVREEVDANIEESEFVTEAVFLSHSPLIESLHEDARKEGTDLCPEKVEHTKENVEAVDEGKVLNASESLSDGLPTAVEAQSPTKAQEEESFDSKTANAVYTNDPSGEVAGSSQASIIYPCNDSLDPNDILVNVDSTRADEIEDSESLRPIDASGGVLDTVLDTTFVANTSRSTSASPTTENLILSYATFKPITQDEADVAVEDGTKDTANAQDLPQLDDISVDSSNESVFSTEVVPETNVASVDSDRPPSPQRKPASDDASCSIALTASFAQRQEPDGDCDFLNQTLNISAIEPSNVLSETFSTLDFVVASATTVEEKAVVSGTESPQDINDDAPGNVAADESKVISDASLILSKPPEAEVERPDVIRDHDSFESASEGHDESIPLADENEVSAESFTSYISMEPRCDGVELIRAMPDQSAPTPLKISKPCHPPLSFNKKFSESMLSSGDKLPPRRPSPSAMAMMQQSERDEGAPISRMRKTRACFLHKVTSLEPDGTVLPGGLKKSLNSRIEGKPKPRVSFATTHCQRSLKEDSVDLEDESRTKNSLDFARRARFAAYLRKRMIDYDDDVEEDEEDIILHLQEDDYSYLNEHCQAGIPKILDPSAMCTSVESSFTTLVSKPEGVDDSDVHSAVDLFMGRKKSRIKDYESDSDYSYDTNSDEDSYDEDDDDGLTTGFFSSLFAEDGSTAKTFSDQFPEWCKGIAFPSVLQLEDALKVATDFGQVGVQKKVTHKPNNSDQDALSEFVDELEKEEPLLIGGEKESAPATLSRPEDPPKPNIQPKVHRPTKDPSVRSDKEVDDQDGWGFLTFEDMHELALMAAAAMDKAAVKRREKRRPLTLKPHHFNPLLHPESVEGSWDNVEQTVTDHESVTGQNHQERSKAQDRIAAKLEQIKKTQPQVYKVFLAKMAAAEKSSKKFDFHRDNVLRIEKPEKRTVHPRKPAKRMQAVSKFEKVQSNNLSVKIHVGKTETSPVDSSGWESFEASPFKEPNDALDVNDEASFFDDMKWLTSAKDSFNSTMERFMGPPQKVGRPLKTKLAQYSKTHPDIYRILLEKIGDREKGSQHSSTPQVESITSAAATSERDIPMDSSEKFLMKEFLVEQLRSNGSKTGDVHTKTQSQSVANPESILSGSVALTEQASRQDSSATASHHVTPQRSNIAHHVRTTIKPSESQDGLASKSTPTSAEGKDLQSRRQASTKLPSLHHHDAADLALSDRVGGSSPAHPLRGRSMTPVSSNRTGESHLLQRPKTEISGTPRASNRTETAHKRPPVTKATTAVRKEARIEQIISPQSKQPEPESVSVASHWETFEGSTFKDFVMQPWNSPASNEDADARSKPAMKETTMGKNKIDLHATTFLDSILPAPPSFPAPAQTEFQRNQDPWQFSEREKWEHLSEQWEHFSPLSFDTKFKNWGLRDKAPPKPAVRFSQARTKSSPSSIAEF